MRKGRIIIFTNNNTEADKCFDYLLNNLKNIKQKSSGMRLIKTNEYDIHIGDINCWQRAYRPEVVYVYRELLEYLESELMNDVYQDIQIKTKMYSERKEPIRFIADFSEIDLKELEDDNYAMMNKIKD